MPSQGPGKATAAAGVGFPAISGINQQGFPGGANPSGLTGVSRIAGGGGGAGQIGQYPGGVGNGGYGILSSISGANLYYAGGGGGGHYSTNPGGAGGAGGAGAPGGPPTIPEGALGVVMPGPDGQPTIVPIDQIAGAGGDPNVPTDPLTNTEPELRPPPRSPAAEPAEQMDTSVDTLPKQNPGLSRNRDQPFSR